MGLFDLLIWSAISRDMSRAGWDAERMAREIMTSPAPQYTYPTTELYSWNRVILITLGIRGYITGGLHDCQNP